jgi:hypothetical protein
VQIIEDDKGVHIVVAAANLHESVPEAGILDLTVCSEIVDQVDCAIGMALGKTFYGVTGSAAAACRCDITGPFVVRSGCLMQYALTQRVLGAVDLSVYNEPIPAACRKLLDGSFKVKGSAEPVQIYTFSDSRIFSAFWMKTKKL